MRLVEFGIHFSCSSRDQGDWTEIYQQALSQAQIADEVGFRFAVVAEHHFTGDGHIPSPMILCGAMAAVTIRIHVGTDVVVTPLHHPLRIAEDILVLDNLSKGRAFCGVGMGSSKRDFAALGVPFQQRPSRTEEAMVILRSALTGDPIFHRGRYFEISDLAVSPAPVQQPCPPVFYGCMSEAGAIRAARFADGMIIGPNLTLERISTIRSAYESEREELGLPSKGRILLRRDAVIDLGDSGAFEIGMGALHYQYSQVYRHIPTDISRSDFEDFVDGRFVVGDPASAADQISAFARASHCEAILFRIQMPGIGRDQIEESISTLGGIQEVESS